MNNKLPINYWNKLYRKLELENSRAEYEESRRRKTSNPC